MPTYPFVTADVFTDRQFGGNPLAVVTDARGLSAGQMQVLAQHIEQRLRAGHGNLLRIPVDHK